MLFDKVFQHWWMLDIYEETGDAEAHGIASLLTKYNTVACIYMLSDVLHTVAKLQGKEVDLASVPAMVESHYPTTEVAERECKQQYMF